MTSQQALRAILRPPIVTRSLIVALVVGAVLNLINQGDAIVSGAPVQLGKLMLTFTVPFMVSSYGSWSALRSAG